MKVNNLSELENALNKQLSDALMGGVKEEVEKLLKSNIKSVVYEAYNPPQSYNRQYLMYESDNYEMIDINTLKVTHARMDSGNWGSRNVSNVVESGRGYIWGLGALGGEGSLDNIIGPRPFMKTTEEQLKDGEFKRALIKSLSKQGFKVK